MQLSRHINHSVSIKTWIKNLTRAFSCPCRRLYDMQTVDCLLLWFCYFILFYFILFYLILFYYFFKFYFILFHFISFHFISFYFILFYFILFLLFYFISLYFIVFGLIRLHSGRTVPLSMVKDMLYQNQRKYTIRLIVYAFKICHYT
jgi:hypothetical protein